MWYFLEQDIVSKLIEKKIPASHYSISKPRNVSGTIFDGSYLKQAFDVLGFKSSEIKITKVSTDVANVSLLTIEFTHEAKNREEVEQKEKEGQRRKKEREKQRIEFKKNKERFNQEYAENLNSLLRPVPEQVEESKAKLTQNLFENVRKLKKAYAEMMNLFGAIGFADEFDRLRNMPEIRDIEVAKESINIAVKVGGASYYLEIPLPNYSGTIKIHTLFSRRPAWVDSSGRPCFGDIESTVESLTTRREYVALIKLLIIFIWNGIQQKKDKSWKKKKDVIELWRTEERGFNIFRHFRKKRAAKHKERYVELMKNISTDKKREAEVNLHNLKDSLNHTKTLLLKWFRSEKFPKTTKAEIRELVGKWRQDFQELAENEDINTIKLFERGIEIHTQPITIQVWEQITIGEFNITINLDTGELRVQNTTNKKEDFDHLIVRNGFPFLDADTWLTFTKLIARFEIPMAVNVILENLQNPQDPLVSAEGWK